MANETERQLKSKVRREIRSTDSEIETFLSRLDRILERGLTKVVRDAERGLLSAAEVSAELEALQRQFIEFGLEEEIGRIERVHEDELMALREDFQQLTGRNVFTDADEVVVETLINNNIDKVLNVIDTYVVNAKDQVMSSIILGSTVDVPTLHEDLGGRALGNIKTELNTSIQGFNREVAVKKAVDVFGENPNFVYIGPQDKVTRDFCRGLLDGRQPPIYSKKEIEALDNGQGLEVLIFGGGFNCRHRWVAVSGDLEQELRA